MTKNNNIHAHTRTHTYNTVCPATRQNITLLLETAKGVKGKAKILTCNTSQQCPCRDNVLLCFLQSPFANMYEFRYNPKNAKAVVVTRGKRRT
ncbi:MAG: hypothetical protein FWC33_06075 [Candidatus Bathyarchaeota archaeon]|nr:hypothetical protein [Candidatus Termiticorpusculum sp.]